MDLQHAVRAVKEHAKDEWGGFLVGALEMCAPLATDELFHVATDGVFARLAEAGRVDLLGCCKNHCWFWNGSKKKWDALWRTGLSTPWKCGLAPDTLGQAVESFWSALKQALPEDVAT